MRRVLVLVVLLAALAMAQFVRWVEYDWFGYEFAVYRRPLESVFDVWLEQYRGGSPVTYTMYAYTPGVSVSALTPDGRIVNTTYARATALFRIPPLNLTTDFRWYLFFLGCRGGICAHTWNTFYNRFLPDTWFYYGLRAALRVGEGRMLVVDTIPLYGGGIWFTRADRVWFLEGFRGAPFYFVYVEYRIWYDGRRELCARVVDRRAVSTSYPKVERCAPWPRAPVNITIATYDWGAAGYADGVEVLWVATNRGAPPPPPTALVAFNATHHGKRPWLAVEPMRVRIDAYIYIDYVAIPKKPMWVTLLVGNDTLSLPPYYTNRVGFGYFSVRTVWDGSGVLVLPPPRLPEEGGYRDGFVLAESPVFDFRIHGRTVRLRALSLLPEPDCEYAAEGAVAPADRFFNLSGLRGLVAYGPGALYCREYRVSVRLPNGTAVELRAPPNSTFAWTPPPYVYFGNGTRLADPEPVVLRVNYSSVTVDARYRAREHLVVVEAPLGREERWLREGSRLAYGGGRFDLGNGTLVVVEPLEYAAYAPAVLRPRYEVYYRVAVVLPWGRNETWAPRGSRFEYRPPEFADLGNGTALAGPNGTCAFAVESPRVCAVSYGERLYWVEAASPAWRYANWTPAGSAVRPPPVVDLGNGTRLVDPDPAEVRADGPRRVAVRYRVQYYVRVRALGGVWEGWRYAGSAVVLNGTEVGGVRYAPVTASVEVVRPLDVRVNYTASYYAEFKDALGLPNPWASVRLCGNRFAADSAGRVYARAEADTLCDFAIEAPPIGPYSLATLATVSAAVAFAAVRRLARKR